MGRLDGYVPHSAVYIKGGTAPEHYPDTGLPEVAFAGRSNVGKSSLINNLTGRTRLARTSRTPGRTQIIQFFNIADRFCFGDLPGYGFAKVPHEVKDKWGKMIENYLKTRETLCAVIVLMDLRRGIQEDDIQLIEALPFFQIQPILVFTKADKYKRNARLQRRRELAAAMALSMEGSAARESRNSITAAA